MEDYNGLGLSLGSLAKVSTAKTRSISAENFTGEKGKAAIATSGTGKEYAHELGTGWKISPSIIIKGETTVTLADINGSGAIQHIWLTCHPTTWRTSFKILLGR